MPMSGADWAKLAAGIGGTALTAYMMKRQGDQQAQQNQQQMQMSEEQSLRDTALKESLADPFRHLRQQGAGLTSMDLLANFPRTSSNITPPANVAPYMGTVSRGWTPSESLRTNASKLYDAIAAGRTAPTMTDPANYGRTGALNLTSSTTPSAGGGGTAPNAAIDPMSYLEGYSRRGGPTGGVGKGMLQGASMGSVAGPYGAAAGLVAGGVIGAIRKHAQSAPQDLTVDQARQIIAQVYQREGGRTPSPQEIDQIIAGQGYKPGDYGVGEEGLLGVIRNLQANFAAERRGQAA